MIAIDKTKITHTLKTFRSRMVMTLQDLIIKMGCSGRTVSRYLQTWGTLSSYNANGRYYVLPDVPRFDDYGLWRHRDIFFSKHGNLKQTVIALITQSEAGLNVNELGKLIGLSARSFIPHFNSHPAITRELKGRAYIYYASDHGILNRQKKSRRDKEKSRAGAALPDDSLSIKILVEKIRNPREFVGQLASRLRRRGINVSSESINNLLRYHNLLKKTPDLE